MAVAAGVQFSLPLIDFVVNEQAGPTSWGSVLITPDRLHHNEHLLPSALGFSSHYP